MVGVSHDREPFVVRDQHIAEDQEASDVVVVAASCHARQIVPMMGYQPRGFRTTCLVQRLKTPRLGSVVPARRGRLCSAAGRRWLRGLSGAGQAAGRTSVRRIRGLDDAREFPRSLRRKLSRTPGCVGIFASECRGTAISRFNAWERAGRAACATPAAILLKDPWTKSARLIACTSR
jgi:hypothetical protein